MIAWGVEMNIEDLQYMEDDDNPSVRSADSTTTGRRRSHGYCDPGNYGLNRGCVGLQMKDTLPFTAVANVGDRATLSTLLTWTLFFAIVINRQ